jgi:hypothetical protein
MLTRLAVEIDLKGRFGSHVIRAPVTMTPTLRFPQRTVQAGST